MASSVGMSGEWEMMGMERHPDMFDWQHVLFAHSPSTLQFGKDFGSQSFIGRRNSSSFCEYFVWQRGVESALWVWVCGGGGSGFPGCVMNQCHQSKPLMRHFLVVFCIIPHQGQTRSSNRRVYPVLRRLLCSYLRPGHWRSSQWQYNDQGNWTGTVNTFVLMLFEFILMTCVSRKKQKNSTFVELSVLLLEKI